MIDIQLIGIFIRDYWPSFTVITLTIIIEIISRNIKRKLKRSIFSQYDGSTDPKHGEYYLEYYRKSQLVDMIRIIAVIACFGFVFIRAIDQGINLLAVAIGAIIITFKDIWLSILAFFFVVPQYSVGNIISIDKVQGQIIFIRMFSVGVLGKDNNGESTGQLFVIPNHKFLTESVRKEELQTSSVMRTFFAIPYRNEYFEGTFTDFLKELTIFLDTIFPVGSRKNVGNYQSYLGHRYKLDYEYKENECLFINLSFIGKSEKNRENIAKIIAYVEGKRLKQEQYCNNYARNNL